MAVAEQAPVSLAESSGCLTTNLSWLLGQANHAFGSEVAGALAPLGLGSRGYCVLAAAQGGGFTQTQLAGAIGLDKTTMVVTVDELERLGLAERTASATDRRARVIKVTAAGRRKVAEGQRMEGRDLSLQRSDGKRQAHTASVSRSSVLVPIVASVGIVPAIGYHYLGRPKRPGLGRL